MSSSPIKFHDSDYDQSAAGPTDVAMDTNAMETESMCTCHNADADEADECVACDERERFALLDSPPLSVLTGKVTCI